MVRNDLIARPNFVVVGVTADVFDKATHFSTEEIESINNIRDGEGFEWKNLIVMGGPVNKTKTIVGTPYGQVTTKTNIHMDLVQVLVDSMINRDIVLCFA